MLFKNKGSMGDCIEQTFIDSFDLSILKIFNRDVKIDASKIKYNCGFITWLNFVWRMNSGI